MASLGCKRLTTLVGRLSGIRTQSGQSKINNETKVNDDKYLNTLIYMPFILWSIRYCCDTGKEKLYPKQRAYVSAC
jgi:hypothetical protein